MTLAEQAKDTFPSGLHATVRPIFDDFARGTDRGATLAHLGALIDLPDVLIADYTADTPPDQPLAFYTIVLPGGSTGKDSSGRATACGASWRRRGHCRVMGDRL